MGNKKPLNTYVRSEEKDWFLPPNAKGNKRHKIDEKGNLVSYWTTPKLTKKVVIENMRKRVFGEFPIDRSESIEDNFIEWNDGKEPKDGYFVKNHVAMTFPYPYGRDQTVRANWIESDPNCGQKTKSGKWKSCNGQRVCNRTINPKTKQWNNPKCGTYSQIVGMHADYDDLTSNGVPKIGYASASYNSPDDWVNEFVDKYGKFFTDFEREQLEDVEIWNKAMKHITFEIVKNPSSEEYEEIKQKGEENVRKALAYEYAKAHSKK